MVNSEPNRLYKYSPINTNSLKGLINKEVWLSTNGAFNDPFELSYYLDNRVGMNEVIGQSLEKSKEEMKGKKPEEIAEIINRNSDWSGYMTEDTKINTFKDKNDQHLSQFGVYCLSETFRSILMWSHYANDHKGFCIEFERNERNTLGSKNTHKVNYKPNLPLLTLDDFKASNIAATAEKIFLTKFEEWSYEEEWRIVCPEGNKLYELPGNITKIIFGLKTSKEDMKTIYNITKDIEGIQYSKMSKDIASFSLSEKEIRNS
tara:strand:- start:1515 stop:2297 length:783 start_codon:yes stop_codon:yes gene_type:complete